MDDTRDRLAAYAHEAWSGWMRYMFGKSQETTEGEVVIPPDLAQRWRRQMNTAYSALPDDEKLSDLAEADKMLAIFNDEREP